MSREIVRVLTVLAISVVPSAVLAQGGVVGSIVGNVFDQIGNPIKGVKVVAKSDTHIGGPKTTYTNDEGYFRIPALQPGDFELTATAPKLKSVHQKGVKVGLSAAAEVTLIMEVETATEEVKVIEKAPIVSTTTAVVKEVYDEEFIDNLPLESRTAAESFVGYNVPGAVYGSTRTARVRGGNENQNSFMVDGFHMNGQKTTYKSLSAMEVQTAGYGADGATTPGGLVTMVTKSGSNKYEFDVNGFHQDSLFRIFAEPGERETRSWQSYINPNFSGPIVKDRLWFYINAEARSEIRGRDPDPSGFFPDPPTRSYGSARGTAKFTWQVTPRNKIQSFSVINRDFNKNFADGLNIDRDAQRMIDHFDYFTGLTWESLLTDTLFFKTQVGNIRTWEWGAPEMCRSNPVNCDHIVPVVQSYPQTIRLHNHNESRQIIINSIEFVNTLEWFGHSKTLGDHNVKLVSRYFTQTEERAFSTPGDKELTFNGQLPERERIYFANDPRIEPERFGWNIQSSQGFRWINTVTDSARITRYLTLNPGIGVTATGSENSTGEQVTGALAVTPHISVAWDPTHDGRTVLRASFNNYVDADVGRLARHSLGGRVSRECRWNEGNQDFTDNCSYSGGASGRTFGLPCGPQGFDEYGQDCREKLRIPRTWEYTVGAEREIIQGVGLGSDFIYRDYTYPYSIKETNRIWNQAGTALEPTGRYRNGRSQTINDLETPWEARRKYMAVTTSVHKREGAFKINTSYTWSELYGNVHNMESNDWGNIPPRDPLLWGYLPDDSRHTIKTTMTYQWTKWLTTGFTHRYYSGRPYQRRFRNAETGNFDDYRARVGINPGTNINDPEDDRPLRLPDIQQFNLQIRSNLKPLTGLNLDVYTDIMNVLGLRTTTSVVQDDGPRWSQPSGRMGPMNARFGFRFKY
jgi:hypothetical protein